MIAFRPEENNRRNSLKAPCTRTVLFLNPKFTTEEAYPYVIPRGNPHIHRQ